MKKYINYITERYDIDDEYTQLAISLINAISNDGFDKNIRKLIDFDIDYDFDIETSWKTNILKIDFNVIEFFEMLDIDAYEYDLSTLSEWTGYDTPDEDLEELTLENNINYFNDETNEYIKKILNLFEIKTTDDDFQDKVIMFFNLFENNKEITDKITSTIWSIRGMISTAIKKSATEIESKINFEFGYNDRIGNMKPDYDMFLKINLIDFKDEKTVKEYVSKSKDGIESIDNFKYEYIIDDDESNQINLNQTNKNIRDYELKKIFEYCEFEEEDLIFNSVVVSDDNINDILKIGGLFKKVIYDYKTQKDYITYYDNIDLNDIDIKPEKEKINRIKTLQQNNIILPKVDKEFGYLVNVSEFNI